MIADNQYTITEDSSGLCDTPGFLAAGVSCDIRNLGNEQLDVALIHSPTPCTAAGVFTTNDIKAAPVLLCQQHLAQDSAAIHTIVINSGNANACTGDQGKQDTQDTATYTAGLLGLHPQQVLPCSTGRIGQTLPMGKLKSGITSAVNTIAATTEHSQSAAKAILTSDTHTKTITAQWLHNNQKLTLSGMAKGAGMIEPNMATMLAFFTTDVAISQPVLQQALTDATANSFNAITVDGDMSTNDTVIALANGTAGTSVITEPQGEAYETFLNALTRASQYLAEKIVGDGEKVTKLVEILVHGATDATAADKVARAVGNSLLVKSSWYGNDPNWGRILDAAGYARTGIANNTIDLYYNNTPVLIQGTPKWEKQSEWKIIVSKPRFQIRLVLNQGSGHYRLLASDLSEAYVKFNKSE